MEASAAKASAISESGVSSEPAGQSCVMAAYMKPLSGDWSRASIHSWRQRVLKLLTR